jgi:uncharacterized protein YcbX
MARAPTEVVGTVVALWRYPVKSMLGEALHASDVTARGLAGDRAYALIDAETGKVVSAKNPRKWPTMFQFRTAFCTPPSADGTLPPASVTLPSGAQVRTDDPDAAARLSEALGRSVRLESTPPETPTIEGYWPDHDWLQQRDEVFDVKLPPGTFFDLTPLHIVTTATLDRLGALAPGHRFEPRRFRPNVVIAPRDGSSGFVENQWVGRTLHVGAEVVLRITEVCPRCVMTTLGQDDLPKDPGVLRAAVEHNDGNVGVCAAVVQGGTVRRGDAVVAV